MQVALLLADLIGEIPLRVLDAAWDAWIAPSRGERKLAHLEKMGALAAGKADDAADRIVRLTEAGRLAAHGGRDPEQCWRRAWDGRWRMVLFDVAERHRSKRIRLQRQLRRAHFGYLQDSVWITPDSLDVLEAWMREGGSDLACLSFLEARPCVGSTDSDLVTGAWDFASINQGYAQHGDLLRNLPSPQASARIKREWLRVEWRAWQRALQQDPLLPESLLPTGYRGRRAWETRRDRLRKLLTGT